MSIERDRFVGPTSQYNTRTQKKVEKEEEEPLRRAMNVEWVIERGQWRNVYSVCRVLVWKNSDEIRVGSRINNLKERVSD